MTEAERLHQHQRRARASAAGLCAICCRATPVLHLKNCARCIEAIRKAKAKRTGKPYKPLYDVTTVVQCDLRRIARAAFIGRLPRLPVSTVPFDIEADRREEWLALSEISAMHRVGYQPCA